MRGKTTRLWASRCVFSRYPNHLHLRCRGGLHSRCCIFKHQTCLWGRATQSLRSQEEDVWSWFPSEELGVVSLHTIVEHRKPPTPVVRFQTEIVCIGARGHSHRDSVQMQMGHQFDCSRHRFALRKMLLKYRRSLLQELLRRDGELELLNNHSRNVKSLSPLDALSQTCCHELLLFPWKLSKHLPGRELISPLGVEQQAIEIKEHMGDAWGRWGWC